MRKRLIYKTKHKYSVDHSNAFRIFFSDTILTLWVWISLRWGVLDATLYDKVCQWLGADRWLSPGTPISSTDKTDRHDIPEILLKVAKIP
jgi:hypothetical protein